MPNWLSNLLVAFADRYKGIIPGHEAYRGDRQQKTKACKEAIETT